MVAFASRTSTEQPGRASVIAAASPFGPDPTTTASHAYDMVMHYQPLWGVREQLFLLCCPETAHRCSQTEVASGFRTPSWRPADIAEARRAFLPLNAILLMMPETAEEISQQPEVRKELQRATGEKRSQKVKAHGRDKLWFVTHTLILAGCAVLYFLLGSKLILLPQPTVDIAGGVLRGAALIVIVLAIAKAASVYGLGRIEDASTRFTLQRIAHLVVALLIALIAISIIFVNWYATV